MVSVDVVIPTYNRPGPLLRCLESLAAQTARGFGVIVVDDAGHLDARDTVADARVELPSLRVVRMETNGGPAAARNAAVAVSSADYVAFTDDDVVVHPRWLERLLARAAGQTHTVVFGPALAPRDWRPTPWNLWEARTLARQYRKIRDGLYEPGWRQFFTGNALVPRADFIAAGSFDEHFIRAEDIEFGIRLEKLGCRLVFEPKAVVWHYAWRPAASWLALPRGYARADVAIARKYPELNWLATIEEELALRRLPLRVAARAVRGRALRAAAAQAGIAAARLLLAGGARGAAMSTLSAVYDIEYRAGLAAALAEAGLSRAPGRPAALQGRAA